MDIVKLNFKLTQHYAKDAYIEKHGCYINSFRLMPSVFSMYPDVKYCEGYAASTDLGVPLHHGWLEVESSVIDISWGIKYPKIAYCAQMKLSMKELMRIVTKVQTMPLTDFAFPLLLKLQPENPWFSKDIQNRMRTMMSAFEAIGNTLENYDGE